MNITRAKRQLIRAASVALGAMTLGVVVLWLWSSRADMWVEYIYWKNPRYADASGHISYGTFEAAFSPPSTVGISCGEPDTGHNVWSGAYRIDEPELIWWPPASGSIEHRGGSVRYVSFWITGWALALLLGTPGLVCAYFGFRRVHTNACARCGYDLTGIAGVCPECGEAVSA